MAYDPPFTFAEDAAANPPVPFSPARFDARLAAIEAYFGNDTATDPTTLPIGAWAFNGDGVFQAVQDVGGTNQWVDVTTGTPPDLSGYAQLANDIAALEALSGTGFAARTGTNTWANRSLTAPAAGITITNPGGGPGNPTFALANDLAALEALSGTDTIYYRSGTDTWTAVTIGSGLTFSGGTLDAISGIYRSGGADVAVADGGTGSSTASGARSNLGLAIGSNVQGYSSRLDAVAAVAGSALRTFWWDVSGALTSTPMSAVGATIVGLSTYTAIGNALGFATTDSPQFAGINIGHATDTTLSRTSAGVLNVEGNTIISTLNTATQAQMEAGTSTTQYVPPGRQHNHPGHPKAWMLATVSGGVVTVNASYNFSTSVTRTASGDYTVTLTNGMSSTAYLPDIKIYSAAPLGAKVVTLTQTTIRFQSYNNSAALSESDGNQFAIVVYGDM